jgi:hydrogenase maturation factor
VNLLSGEIVQISSEGDTRIAKVKIGGAFTRVPLTLITNGKVGDTILIESGVAIAKITEQRRKEERDVPGDTGKGT